MPPCKKKKNCEFNKIEYWKMLTTRYRKEKKFNISKPKLFQEEDATNPPDLWEGKYKG